MPKNNKDEVIVCEKKILSKLKANAIRSDHNLAKEMGYSRQKIWRIKKQLKENKTIWGYTVITDEKKQGLIQFFLLIKRSSKMIDERKADGFLSEGFSDINKKNNIEIETIISTYGQYDWIIVINAKDIMSARNFLSDIQTKFNEFIDDICMIESVNAIKKQGIYNPCLNENKMLLRNIL